MDEASRLEVFRAQTANLRALDRARKHLVRSINQALRTGDSNAVHVETRLLAMLRSSWAEVVFSKIIHTPHGLSLGEIEQIKGEVSRNGLEAGWEKCLQLGLSMLGHSPSSSFVPNASQTLGRLISEHVVEPSILRNKVAHGQWHTALNRSNSAVNQAMTSELSGLDPVRINIGLNVVSMIAEVIEDMIESPNKAFVRDYWPRLEKLRSYVEKTSDWNLDSKREQLARKPARP